MGLVEFLKPNLRKILFTIIVVAVIIISLTSYFGVFPFMFKSGSNSMSPTFNRGDVILLKATNFEDLNIGDIVAYSARENRPVIIHRIVSIDYNKGIFDTKGDANTGQLVIEKNVSSNKIYGQYVGSIPFLGYLGGFVWIIGILIVYLISCLIFRGAKPAVSGAIS